MLSAGLVHQQARYIWATLGCSGQFGAVLSCCQAHPFSSFVVNREAGSTLASTNDVDIVRSSDASCSGRAEPLKWFSQLGTYADQSDQRASRPPAVEVILGAANHTALRGAWRADSLGTSLRPGLHMAAAWMSAISRPLPFGRRMYHAWYYGTKLRNRTITSVSSLEDLAKLLQQEGKKLDHVNLVVVLRQLQLLASQAAAKAAAAAGGPAAAAAAAPVAPTPTAASAGSQEVAAAVTAATARAVKQQVLSLAARTSRLARKRAKWYDPRNAAAVVHYTAGLGYTNDRLLEDMTARTMARLNEAYSRDLLGLLRGLKRHGNLSAAAIAAAAVKGRRSGNAMYTKRPYHGPPTQFLEAVEQFLRAKIPTGRMPPENVDGLLRYLQELSPGQRPVEPKLLSVVETDLRTRMSIYAPRPLAGVLEALALQQYPIPSELLDAAACQFSQYADTNGTGMAAARFLSAAAAFIRNRQGTDGSDKEASPGNWLMGRQELLAKCLKLMSKDLSGHAPDRLVDWMAALERAEVPLSALSAAAAAPSAAIALDSSKAWSSSPALTSLASSTLLSAAPSTLAAATPAPTSGSLTVSTAAAAFVKAHVAAVEALAPRLQSETKGKLKGMYDTYGLPYPRGL